MAAPITFSRFCLYHTSPDWRWKIISKFFEPLEDYVRTQVKGAPPSDGNYLFRFMKQGVSKVRVSSNYRFFSGFRTIIDSMDAKHRAYFARFNKKMAVQETIRAKAAKDQYDLNMDPDANLDTKRPATRMWEIILNTPVKVGNLFWKLGDLKNIQDDTLIRVFETIGGKENDEAINFAINIRSDVQYDEIMKVLGQLFYLGNSDEEIAIKWKMKVSYIKAIRSIHFDFSRLPYDRIARRTFFKQYVTNEKDSYIDFEFYKLLDDLGETGFRAITDFQSLSDDDKRRVEIYLGNSMIENVLRIKLSVRSLADSNNYNNVINMLGTFYVKTAEVGLAKAKVRHIDATTNKLETDMGNTVKKGAEHEKLYDIVKEMKGNVRQIALNETEQPKWKPISELK